MPTVSGRTRVFITVGVFGILLLATGLAWDLVAHARDSGLAAEEGVLSFGNPSHVLIGLGILAAVAGLLGTAWEILVAGRDDTRLARFAGLAVVAGIALAVAIGAALAVTLPHRHEDGHANAADAIAERPISSAVALAVDRSRLPADEALALATLSWSRPGLVGEHEHHGHGDPYDGPPPQAPLSAQESLELGAQLEAAAAVAANLADTAAAAAAGYVQSATEVPGVGSHWTKWSLVDYEFDPARPSQLLFQEPRPGKSAELAGFSYWVRSTNQPEGFAGPNDHWHQHSGLCFENGWLRRENLPNRADCAGDWINGSDLWMLHAWVVPGAENEWGVFAEVNPALCPDPRGLPDLLTCDPGGV
jgi:hypothetical protein